MPSDLAAGSAPVRLLGVEFAGLGPDDVLGRLAARPATFPFAYVVTPNADHLNRLSSRPELKPLYDAAALRLLDSRVVARLARLFGLPAPPVVTGSGLTEAMFDRVVAPDDPIVVLGSSAENASALRARYGLTRLAHHDPPMGFERDPAALEAAIRFLEEHPARFAFLAVGSPRQEIVAEALVRRGKATGVGLHRREPAVPHRLRAPRAPGRAGRRAGLGLAMGAEPAAPGAALPPGQPTHHRPALARSPTRTPRRLSSAALGSAAARQGNRVNAPLLNAVHPASAMPGLDAGISTDTAARDGRVMPGHDGNGASIATSG